jgi:ankyrin repeat protein
MHALLLAGATTQLLDVRDHNAPQCTSENGDTALQYAEAEGHTAIAALIRQHAAPPQPAAAAPAAPSDAGTPAVSSPSSLPLDIFESARRGELQSVGRWLSKGGSVDALCSPPTTAGGQREALSLLHAAVGYGHLELVRMLLKHAASVDLPSRLGGTALMKAAHRGHLPIVLVLLQHSADPDLQDPDGITALMSAAGKGRQACVKALLRAGAKSDLQSNNGITALMRAAFGGQEACVQALLRAKANTELLDNDGYTARQYAEAYGHTAIVALIRQHACLSLGLAALAYALP